VSAERSPATRRWRADARQLMQPPLIPADGAGGDPADRVDFEVGGAAVGAAVGAAGSLGAATHAAHRGRPSCHGGRGGSRHHVLDRFPSGSRVSRAPAVLTPWRSARRFGLDGPLHGSNRSRSEWLVVPGTSRERFGSNRWTPRRARRTIA